MCYESLLRAISIRQVKILPKYQQGLCQNAELIQRESMCFKTNYRNIDDAKVQVNLLVDLINSWG